VDTHEQGNETNAGGFVLIDIIVFLVKKRFHIVITMVVVGLIGFGLVMMENSKTQNPKAPFSASFSISPYSPITDIRGLDLAQYVSFFSQSTEFKTRTDGIIDTEDFVSTELSADGRILTIFLFSNTDTRLIEKTEGILDIFDAGIRAYLTRCASVLEAINSNSSIKEVGIIENNTIKEIKNNQPFFVIKTIEISQQSTNKTSSEIIKMMILIGTLALLAGLFVAFVSSNVDVYRLDPQAKEKLAKAFGRTKKIV
jgi:hypothetical protein